MLKNKNIAQALIVDDEADIRELVEITLSRMAIETVTVADLGDAVEALQHTSFDLCLTDLRLPDGSGIDLVGQVNKLQPSCPVAVITAFGSAETAVASLKAGAFDFVSKPVDISVLRRLVEQAVKLTSTEQKRKTAAITAGTESTGPRLIGQTLLMQNLRKMIAKLARSQAPVYITGESGTGKELVARKIHTDGPRADAAFVPVNCGAIPAELMEAEFFGYRKGAFTGADRDYSGLVAQAEGGTLFLDEIADLPLSMQVKLLRVIQERTVRRIGETNEQSIDMRIICATHHDLADEVAQGNFRKDLFYRLNVIEVVVPPLRERIDDIQLLADLTLKRLAEQLALNPAPTLSAAAMDTLRSYSFPGNIRELENILERAVTLSDDSVVEPEFLRLQIPSHSAFDNNGSVHDGSYIPVDGNLEGQLEALERQRILGALVTNRYNKTRAAKALGITFRALRYRMDKLEIQ